MKIYFIAAHRKDRSPSQRFRFEQYFDYLASRGWEISFSYLLDEEADKIIYKPGHYLSKAKLFFKSILKRLSDIGKAKEADVVFVQREAFMTSSVFFEKQFAKHSKLVFDFDDSIWLHDVNPNQGILNRLKNADKTAEIITISDLAIAGNPYLADYAKKYSKHVVIIPTTIDTEVYQKIGRKGIADKICIGWSGSFSTIKHFETVVPALRIIKNKYGDLVYFKVIGDESYKNPELNISGLPWKKETEIEDLSEIAIGLMPLPDDEWSRGKCGLKGLQYMALEIVTIMSPVGVNTDIISDGVNGFLAGTTEEWVSKLSMLIEDNELRVGVGRSGRKTVLDHYSVLANQEKYGEVLEALFPKK